MPCVSFLLTRTAAMHVQLTRGHAPHAALEQGLLCAIGSEVRPAQLVLWPYANFPFGVTLGYQLKFSHYVSAERDVDIPT
jgi:hypothetical protein